MKKLINNRKLAGIILIVTLVIVIGIIIYLNRLYAHIYDYRGVITNTNQLNTTYTLENPQGRGNFKYVAIGDSLTFGLGAKSFEETFPYIMAQKLSQKYQYVEVKNLAISGATIPSLINIQLDRAIAEQPDLITLMIGTNDVHNFFSPGRFSDQFETLLIKLTKKTQAKVIVINIPFLGTKDLIKPPFRAALDLEIQQYNKLIKQTTDKLAVKYIDLYTLNKPYFESDESYYSPDGFHPSGKGYILWGRLINEN